MCVVGEVDTILGKNRSFYVDTMYKIIIVFFSIGRSLPHITDVSWRLEYQIKVKFNKLFSRGNLGNLKKK